MTPAAVAIDVVEKSFRGSLLLKDLRIELARGEVAALCGGSGRGRSTLLRIAAGLEREFIGAVLLDGEPLLQPSREVSVFFREPCLLPWLTVAGNVAFGTAPSPCARARVLALLEEVGLRAFAECSPADLSEDMAHRAALARALFRSPKLLLLDEPFSNLEPVARVIQYELLVEAVKRRSASALIVTCNVDEAIAIADRVIAMPCGPGGPTCDIVSLQRSPRRGCHGATRLRTNLLDRLRAAAGERASDEPNSH